MSSEARPPRWRVSYRGLLAVYAIVPACLLLAAADASFGGGGLRRALPYNPEPLFWYNVFFMLPHVFLSLGTFLDSEYLRSYRASVSVGALLSFALPAAAAFLLGRTAFFLFLSVVGVHHVVSQQTGIGKLLLGREGPAGFCLRWTMVAAMSLFWVAVFAEEAHRELRGMDTLAVFFGGAQGAALRRLAAGLLCAVLALAVAATRGAPRRGAAYLWAEVLLVVGAVALGFSGYPFLGILSVRFVHDVTAVYVYAVHGHNRNAAGLPASALLLLLAMGASALVQAVPLLDSAGVLALLAHYFAEGFMWKRGSPHREFVAFEAAV